MLNIFVKIVYTKAAYLLNIFVVFVVAFVFLPRSLGRWWGPTNDGFAIKKKENKMQLE